MSELTKEQIEYIDYHIHNGFGYKGTFYNFLKEKGYIKNISVRKMTKNYEKATKGRKNKRLIEEYHMRFDKS